MVETVYLTKNQNMPRKNSKGRNKKQNHYNEEEFNEPRQKTEEYSTPALDIIIGNIKVVPKTDNQKKFLKSIRENDVTIGIGEAGCGKTFLAVYQALCLLKSDPKYKKILLIKSVTELKNESIGTVPGDKNEKMLLFMMSFLDSFYKLIGESKTKQLIADEIIVFEPIAYARGRNYEQSIVIIDESQNISKDNLKTLLSRISEGSRYIVIGDAEQIDLKEKRESSLEFFFNKVIENPMEGVSAIKFDQGDIVRHRLTSYFLGLFKY